MSVLAILMMIVTGCATVVSKGAVCSGTQAERAAHAAALADAGDPQSMSTGRDLISKLDAACEDQ